MYLFLKPILRNKCGYLERASSSCVRWCQFYISCSACMNSTNPHIHALSVQLSFYLIYFLKDKYIAGCFTLSVGLTQAACSLWIQTYGKRHPKKLAAGITEEWGSHSKQDLLWMLPIKWKENCLRRICCQFCLIPVHIQQGSNAMQLVFYLVWVFFSTLRKAVYVDSSVHDSLKASKVSHWKRKNGGFSLCSLTAWLTCDKCNSRLLWAGKQNKLDVWKEFVEKIELPNF